jgi:plasmid stabilization system protein ParE
MAKQKIEGLISELHQRFGDDETSHEQQALMAQLQSQLAEWEGPESADGDLEETARLLLKEVAERHPKAALVIREILETLANIRL